jgi:hypothetical protein
MPVDETTGFAAGVVSFRSVAVTQLLAVDHAPPLLTANTRNEYVRL